MSGNCGAPHCSSFSVLVVDDDPSMLESIERTLAGLECQVHTSATATEARNLIAERQVDLLILDRVLPDADGVHLLGELRGTGFAAPTIVITAHPTLETAVDALGYWACDYLEKPFTPQALLERVSHALSADHMLDRMTYLWGLLRERHGFDHVMSRSPEVLGTYVAAARVASTNAPILIEGETGTGKEYLAHAIHYMSGRAEEHFVAVNCGALPETLLASELFGHEKGAFTSATQAKVGLCEVADGGTLFLDEVGEMSPENQIKLLRFTQDYTFTRLGGVKPIEVDVRIIAASNSDLSQAVEHGRFRQDLFYRLNVVPLGLPPLSERPEDLEVFARHFLDKHRQRHGGGPRRISDEAIQALAQQTWPGNLRQLENVIQRALLMADGETLRPEHLILEEDSAPFPALAAASRRSQGADPAARFPTLQEIEAQHIARVYEAAGGNKTRAAAILGITPGTLTRKLKQHGIEGG
jgi:DNA-binding NtrC family response regulator